MSEYSQSDIQTILDKLNIVYDKKDGFNRKNWLQIICPFHNDKSLGSCFVSISSVIVCKSCGAKSNLYTVVKNRNPQFKPKDIYKFLGSSVVGQLQSILQKRRELDDSTAKDIFRMDFNSLKTVPVDLNLYYCKTREYSEDWVNSTQTKIVAQGYYRDYFATPIVSGGQIVSYEFRKAYEFERLKEIFSRNRGSLEDLRRKFKELYQKTSEVKDVVKYLKKPKVLYPKDNFLHLETIFNLDNLDKDKDLVICEGVAGTAKIWPQTKNVTALFGSEPTQEQISILNSFHGKKFVVHDGDEAGDKLLWELTSKVENIYVYGSNIRGSDYLLAKSGIFDTIKIC